MTTAAVPANVIADAMVFCVALFASLVLTLPIRRLALHWGLVDNPGPRKVHARPVPLLGGVAIYLGFVMALFLRRASFPVAQIVAIVAGATLLAFVGVLDDRGLLHHQVKLFIAMPVAALLLLASGIRAQLFSVLLPGAAGHFLDACLTVFWVVGITASFSILDHLDGLCAGIAAVAAAFFALAAGMNGQTLVRTLGAAAFGAALGFLIWNFNPAKIFMGDGGAMLLGFLMATLGLKLRPAADLSVSRLALAWLVPILILGVPIFDTTLISISRSRRGLLPFTSPGKDHTAHRLSNLGLGHRGAVIAMYCLAASLGSVALLVQRVPPLIAYVLAAALLICALIGVWLLESVTFERQVKSSQSH
jgi:UDP-GlcNAc:undecaprenyl-phosphate/decaprenyl-phosphate GlcNAc-1-phosphate transferase